MSTISLNSKAPPDIGRSRLLAMSAASGIAVANIYYNQPMLGVMEADFPGQTIVGLIPTATQLGYAAGLFFLLPLGDLVRRRQLIVGQFLVLAVALAAAAIAPSAALTVAASLAVGASSTVAQQIVPFAASLSRPETRGATIGTVMAGVLSGILFSRTLAGFVGEHAGWREMFWLGVPMALLSAGLMTAILPNHAPASHIRYRDAIRSLAHLWRQHSALRVATLTQAALFASFTSFWTILALYIQGPAFNLGADIAGLFGVIGAVGIFAAPIAGRVADRRGPQLVVWVGGILTLVAWAIFGAWSSLVALTIGVVVLDFGIQSALVSNQHIIYALDHGARSRLNTVFMTGMFLGGAGGSAIATVAWNAGGWTAVSAAGALFALIAVCVQLAGLPRRRSRADTIK
ncbi:MFS transporter [Tardiphaga alba]|uniref:MFS transporter n=1 Tax=Tardiphaga alba TaxID=340268 RepID=A0ABX8A6M7_9BRAD|nr:MFS transporter [Tardiphaga alba]QUS38065.1 MFS transporter [Tardiphaga alba]